MQREPYCDLCGDSTHDESEHHVKRAVNTDIDYCEAVRPVRKTICQKPKGHKGSCRAVIFWEK
jgi:hypothetical protein